MSRAHIDCSVRAGGSAGEESLRACSSQLSPLAPPSLPLAACTPACLQHSCLGWLGLLLPPLSLSISFSPSLSFSLPRSLPLPLSLSLSLPLSLSVPCSLLSVSPSIVLRNHNHSSARTTASSNQRASSRRVCQCNCVRVDVCRVQGSWRRDGKNLHIRSSLHLQTGASGGTYTRTHLLGV